MKTITELEEENAGLRRQIAELKRQLVKAFEAMQAEHDQKTQVSQESPR